MEALGTELHMFSTNLAAQPGNWALDLTLHTALQWTSAGEPGTRCKNPSVATHPFSFGHVPKDPLSNRVDCSLASTC